MSLYCNRAHSYLFVNGKEIIKFKAKDSNIVADPLCLGNISKDVSVANMKKRDFMDLSLILVLIIMLLQLMIYYRYLQVFNEKEWHSIKCLDLLS